MDRLTDPFRRSVEAIVRRWLRYSCAYRYSVVSCDYAAQTITARPLSARMPPLDRVPMAVPGIRLDVAPGSIVTIAFADADPTLPYVAQYPQNPAAILRMELCGELLPNARQGDSVSVTIPAGELSLTVAGSAATGPAAPVTLTGTITSGSAKVFS